MENDISEIAEYAIEQSDVTGYLCIDNKGLCLAAKGQAPQSISGLVHQLASLASKIEGPTLKDEPKKESPIIRVDLERYRILIHSHDSITTALMSERK